MTEYGGAGGCGAWSRITKIGASVSGDFASHAPLACSGLKRHGVCNAVNNNININNNNNNNLLPGVKFYYLKK